MLVGAGGKNSWFIQRELRGKTVKVKLGDFPAMPEKQARELALEYSLEMSRGDDPRRKPADAMTLREVFEQHIQELQHASAAASTVKDLRNSMGYCGSLLDVPVSDITKTEITRLRSKFRKRSDVIASRALRNVKAA